MLGNSRVAERLAASEGGLSSMELDSVISAIFRLRHIYFSENAFIVLDIGQYLR
jgi:hypothetical protein